MGNAIQCRNSPSVQIVNMEGPSVSQKTPIIRQRVMVNERWVHVCNWRMSEILHFPVWKGSWSCLPRCLKHKLPIYSPLYKWFSQEKGVFLKETSYCQFVYGRKVWCAAVSMNPEMIEYFPRHFVFLGLTESRMNSLATQNVFPVIPLCVFQAI